MQFFWTGQSPAWVPLCGSLLEGCPTIVVTLKGSKFRELPISTQAKRNPRTGKSGVCSKTVPGIDLTLLDAAGKLGRCTGLGTQDICKAYSHTHQRFIVYKFGGCLECREAPNSARIS